MEAKTADTAQALANIQDENADISTEQKTCYYVSDEQGSVRYVVDESGAVLNRYQYDAFGVAEAEEEAYQNRLRYNGQIYDGMTGQYYLRARYYQPDVGRLTQEDVLYADGLNLYAYCKSNPVMYCDPSGLKSESGCEPKVQPESEGAGDAKFKSQDLLDSHYDKHKGEFGDISKDEYLKGANDLINSTGDDVLTKVRSNGDTLYYNKSTNEFAVKTKEGVLRTFFKPNDGYEYFNRQ